MVIGNYEPISLEEMKAVRLMNRIDTKYLTTLPVLECVLEIAQCEYRVQEIDGLRNMPYYTVYFDTPEYGMYSEHLHGRTRRQKIRIRSYVSSGISFLEIKNKNNKGRTDKKRIPCVDFAETACTDFIETNARYSYSSLSRQIENHFSRITLVNKQLTERLTIDTDLSFHNFATGDDCALHDLVVIELKREGNSESPILDILRRLHIKPSGFSKYCMGMALTNSLLRQNRFKPRLHMVRKMCNAN